MRAKAAVILAAGHGTRMRSPTPKVLQKVGGRAMVDRAIDAVQALGCDPIVVVVGAHSPEVGAHVTARLGAGSVAVQDPPRGTGDAVRAAQAALEGFTGDVVVTCADTPLLDADVIAALFEVRANGADMAVLGFVAADPGAYGRLVMGQGGALLRIVEAREASAQELAIDTCNAAVLAAPAPLLFDLLSQVTNQNAKGEYYLTDVVGLANGRGLKVQAVVTDEAKVMGVNALGELAAAERLFQEAARARMMAEGVAMPAPETVFFAWDTTVAPGAVIEPHVVFGPGVRVGAGAAIRAFSHLEGSSVAEGAIIGPYARLRPGAVIGQGAHIGNFVEVKATTVGVGAKANHLAYLGDGSVGAGANIGAGTIFCNYDGFDKHQLQ
jgi:bifunctional UDP-N-acetylglucosamine pyrophosphorylase/glucosamine-1-phosphate N-acetyltransferase